MKDNSRRQFLKHSGMLMSAATLSTLVKPESALANLLSESKKSDLKWSLYTYTFTANKIPKKELNIDELFKTAKGLGIDAIDIIGAGYNKTWEEMKVIADNYDMKFVCYSGGVKLLESPDASVRKKALSEFRSRLETAKKLGAPRIMMNHGGLSIEPAKNRKFLIESMKEALPIAKAEGIEVTFETHNNPKAPFRTSKDFTEAIEILPDLRITYDCGNNQINGENAVTGFVNNKEHITHIHFKDLKQNGGVCPPGTGIVDFAGLIKEMKKANYKGNINIEMGAKEPSGWDAYKTSLEKLGPLF